MDLYSSANPVSMFVFIRQEMPTNELSSSSAPTSPSPLGKPAHFDGHGEYIQQFYHVVTITHLQLAVQWRNRLPLTKYQHLILLILRPSCFFTPVKEQSRFCFSVWYVFCALLFILYMEKGMLVLFFFFFPFDDTPYFLCCFIKYSPHNKYTRYV